ncbi:MAG: TIGR00645 family protein [Beijerinckiaceae bacterium]|nr:TIGR00645 family protein [Beijerinckiaceae bacterium]
MFEKNLERILFGSRWLLAPFYIALVFCLLGLLISVVTEIFHSVLEFTHMNEMQMTLRVLSIIDLTLMGSLIIIVIFSGYENFVSKIDSNDHPDWPEWMSKIDFSGLKLKLFSSIIAISGIQLLKSFMDIGSTSDRDLYWLVGIHLTFVISGVLFALTDRIAHFKHE